MESFSYNVILLTHVMPQEKEPMSGKKLFGLVAAVMIGVVAAGLVLFTGFL